MHCWSSASFWAGCRLMSCSSPKSSIFQKKQANNFHISLLTLLNHQKSQCYENLKVFTYKSAFDWPADCDFTERQPAGAGRRDKHCDGSRIYDTTRQPIRSTT